MADKANESTAIVMDQTKHNEGFVSSSSDSYGATSTNESPVPNEKGIPIKYQSVPSPAIFNDGSMQCSNGDIPMPTDEDVYKDESHNKILFEFEKSLIASSTSNTQTLMNLIKGNMGTGILAQPLAFKQAGIWTGLAGMLLVGMVALHCMHLLVKSSHTLCKRIGWHVMDYADVAEFCLKTGPNRFVKFSLAARRLVNGLILFTQFGLCSVYIVFVAQSIADVVQYFHPHSPNILVYVVVITLVLVPFVFVRNLEHLAPFSALANILTLLGLVIIFQFILRDIPNISHRPSLGEWNEIPLFLGTAFFSIEGISLILPLENAMKTPERFIGFGGVLNLGMVIVVCLLCAMGFFGYLKLGNDVAPSITLSLPGNNWLYVSVKLMFAIAVFVSYGIQFYVPIQIVWSSVKRKVKHPILVNYGEYFMRVTFVFITFFCAVLVPHLDLLISLIGAFASVFLALILPAIIDLFTLSMEKDGIPRWILAKNIFVIIFGMIGCVFGTYTSMKGIVEHF